MSSLVIYRATLTHLETLFVDASTLDEATLKTGHGVYSVFRVYPGVRVLRLPHHLARMRRSAQKLEMPFPHSDDSLREMLRRAVEQTGMETPRIRLTVPFEAPESAIIALEPFTPPDNRLIAEGVRVALAELHRVRPEVKDSRFIEQRQALWAQHRDAYEILLCDGVGHILEGTGSNFYAVQDGALRTAPRGMLEGIARSILLQVAPEVLPVRFEPAHCADIARLDEAMLTSASRGVIPIVQIGETTIGAGRPGPLTARLIERYNAQVEAELEAL